MEYNEYKLDYESYLELHSQCENKISLLNEKLDKKINHVLKISIDLIIEWPNQKPGRYKGDHFNAPNYKKKQQNKIRAYSFYEKFHQVSSYNHFHKFNTHRKTFK